MTPFTIPNLPTDNLYKFYSLSGIIISFFSLTFMVILTNNIKKDITLLKETETIISLESEFLINDMEKITLNLTRLNEEVDRLENPLDTLIYDYREHDKFIEKIKYDSDYRDYIEFTYKYQNQINPTIAEFDEIKNEHLKTTKKNRQLQIKEVQLDLKQKELRTKQNELLNTKAIGILLIIIGIIISIRGFKLWKINVQKIIDTKLLIELKLLEIELKEKSNK